MSDEECWDDEIQSNKSHENWRNSNSMSQSYYASSTSSTTTSTRSRGNARGTGSGSGRSRGPRGRGRGWASKNDRFGGFGSVAENGFNHIGNNQNRSVVNHFHNGMESYGQGSQTESESEKMAVPKSMIGRLIGRGGSRKRELEDNSGARLFITEVDGEGIVEISGRLEAVSNAKELIQDIIRDMPQNRDYRTSGSSSSFGGGFGGGFGCRAASNDDTTNSNTEPPRMGFSIDWNAVNAVHKSEYSKKWKDCPEIIKEFYIESPEVTLMSREEADNIRQENNNISVVDLTEGENKRPLPNPCVKFEQAFEHYPLILDEIYKQNFLNPSPIQLQMWPITLQGIDCIGIAQTGTGKTLAFLLPALIHIDNQPVPLNQRGGANVLILSPTRELALQIHSEVKKYNYKGIKSCCVYGGGSRKEQVTSVEEGVQIIIATPGRLNDLVNAGIVNVLSITFLVLDEADRMLDMGFEPQIMKILLDIRPDRQTIMTSATWPEGVRRLANKYMTDPMQVFVGSLDLAACHSVTQIVEIIDEEFKRERLTQFLLEEKDANEKCIIFVGKKLVADDISSDFALQGIEAQCIHGGREQTDREQALQDFRDGTVKVLIATDVASRGLDIADISYVFNLDMPRCMEEYVHRVGRTGRAGRSGTSITLVTRRDWASAAQLIDILAEANQEVPDELHDMAQRFRAMKEREMREGGGRGGRGGRGRNDSWGGGFRGDRHRRDNGSSFSLV